MKKLLLFAFLLQVTFNTFAQATFDATLMHDGLKRGYRFFVPKSYNPSKAAPLVFNMHGFGSSAVEQEFYGNFRNIADTAGFILVHPEGTLNNLGIAFFNVGFVPSNVDDLGFINKLIDTLSSTYKIDAKRIYATGMSNGGFMSYNLACNSKRFAAVASVTGSITKANIATCKPTYPMPVMEIHGTADATVPYSGSALFAPIDTVVNYWVKHNACNPIPTVTDVPNTNTTDGATAKRYVYNNGKKGATVELYKVEGGAHTWPGAVIPLGVTCKDFSASEQIWRFFKQFTLLATTDLKDIIATIDFEISPNPSHDWLRIEYASMEGITEGITEKTMVQIVDTQGKTLLSQTLSSENELLDIAFLPNGFYMLKIQNQRGFAVKKFVKN